MQEHLNEIEWIWIELKKSCALTCTLNTNEFITNDGMILIIYNLHAWILSICWRDGYAKRKYISDRKFSRKKEIRMEKVYLHFTPWERWKVTRTIAASTSAISFLTQEILKDKYVKKEKIIRWSETLKLHTKNLIK